MEQPEQSNERIPAPVITPVTLPARRTRRDKKRAFKKIPPMPPGVRALWESADEASRKTAHTMCTAILETWVGKTARAEVAQRLGMSPLRLWQLSQQGLAGMLAGLLKQPRARRGAGNPLLPPEEDPMNMKRRIVKLEQELRMAEDLIALLREMPANKEQLQTPAPKKGRKRKARRRPSTPGKKKSAQERGVDGGASADGGSLAG